MEGNIQAKGKAYDTYGGWGRGRGIERIGVEVMVWTCVREITVRIHEVFREFPQSFQRNAELVLPLLNHRSMYN